MISKGVVIGCFLGLYSVSAQAMQWGGHAFHDAFGHGYEQDQLSNRWNPHSVATSNHAWHDYRTHRATSDRPTKASPRPNIGHSSADPPFYGDRTLNRDGSRKASVAIETSIPR